jgi:hypothetical protein
MLLIGARASGDWMPQPIRRGLTAARAPRASCELVSQVDLLQRDPPTPARGFTQSQKQQYAVLRGWRDQGVVAPEGADGRFPRAASLARQSRKARTVP